MRLNKKGVSLPELLAVIVIMGIIAMIAIPAFTSMISNTEDNAELTELHEIMSRTQIYTDSATNKTTIEDRKAIATLVKNDYSTTESYPLIYFGGITGLLNSFEFTNSGSIEFDLSLGFNNEIQFDFTNSGCNTDGKGITVDNFNDKINAACLI